ncbi:MULTISPECIES: hypothetical protein [unclassified Streptomyces]|uniref:hypothetical protein n=1 Tax=unclassified Streptomyces TaxID=2593676 RepID=UPI000F704077|nr:MULTISPECIES: hypothetical protein [unclassified Streptomyces]AZM63940.1 hypothetical protein DLM49_34150 [Streptomyces sp. WAC 01438]RSM99669.1 hypothetical protein DMA10_05335 [Streptomyces sp. WAC 01420]
MQADLSPVIAATAQWLTRSFPAPGGALAAALCEVQARQAVTVAARLRYPTAMDAALVAVAGPGGSARLDWVTGADADGGVSVDGWRTWVDEVVASWAACLLAEPALASQAVGALGSGAAGEFRRLLGPDETDRRASALLRHPDLLAPVAALHRASLDARLGADTTLAA